MIIKVIVDIILDGFNAIKKYFFSSIRDKYGYIDVSVKIYQPGYGNKKNVYIYENSIIHENYKFITQSGKFIMRSNSIAAPGLTVITFNHDIFKTGSYPGSVEWSNLIPNDVIVEEEVWIGANVTLCPGVHLNRGVIVAAGSVCIKSNYYPPYSIIGGNPAKFLKFRFTIDEQIEHENLRYSTDKLLSIDLLKNNFIKLTNLKFHE